MVYPQGEGNDSFDAPKQDQPYPESAFGGQQPYPPYQDPNAQNPNPQYPNPQYPPQQYANAPYAGAPYAGGYQVSRPTNTLAIVSMVLAVLGLTFLPLIASICAVVCGHISRGQIKRTGEGGSGFATAGLIIGYVSIGLFVIVVGAIIIFAVAAANSSTY